MTFLALLNGVALNLAALIAGLFLVSLTFYQLGRPDRPTALALRYVALVSTSLFTLANSVPLAPGLLFDFRMVPVALVARRHGRLAGLAVALPVGVCRYWMGGVGALPALTQLLLVAWLAAPRGTWLDLTVTEERLHLSTPSAALQLFAVANLPLFVAFALGDRPWTAAIEAYVSLTVLGALGMLLGQVAGYQRVRSLALTQHYQALALTDPLTGLPNRRQFDCDLRDAPLGASVLLLDLDHFKRVNDTYGHEGGDRVLQAFAVVAAYALGTRGRLYRLGGEEFAALLQPGPVSVVTEVAEALRADVQRHLASQAGYPDACFTVSGGWAALGPHALGVADERLYQAKAQGRNRVVSAVRPD